MIGTTLGPYDIGVKIGKGGMGQVYRATDTNLRRDVAVKVLPDAVAADAERVARFQREAQVLASLNHPNIAQVYGVEKSSGRTAIVMELVDVMVDSGTNTDLWALPMTGERRPFVLLKTPYMESYARFSPDGRWFAYVSNESGRLEVYVRPFVPPTSGAPAGPVGQWQVSSAGGAFPAWRADGREVYYLSLDGVLMAVSMTLQDGTPVLASPVRLFQTRIFGSGRYEDGQYWNYAVAQDGRFLVNTLLDGAGSRGPLTLIQHWTPAAR